MSKQIEDLLKLLKEKKRTRDEEGKFKELTIADIAEEYGLEPDDIMLRALSLREFDSPREKRAAVLETAAKMYYNQPSDADTPSLPSQSPVVLNKQERLWQEYQAGSRNLTGTALIKFKQHMREKGLEIS